MAQYQFNPFTNNLDLVGSGSGGSGIQTIDLDSGSITGSTVTIGGGTTGLTTTATSATDGSLTGTLIVGNGGTGTTSLTSNSLLLGNGSSPISALGAMTNGQIVIGHTGSTPIIANLTAGNNISISNGAGSITITANSGAQISNFTSVSSSPYVVLASDYFLGVNTGSAITIQLPDAPNTGRTFVIKDSTGTGATHNITVTTVSGIVTIDGSASFVINQNYGAANFIFDGTSYEVF